MCESLHKIIKKLCKASYFDELEKAREKLDRFQDFLESAYEWHDDHKRRRSRSCSSKKRVARLERACEALHEKYEDELEGDSSESDDEWCVPN